MDKLIVDKVNISYGDNQVVNQASFELSDTAIGCLLGPSGCGKTTLLLAIAGFQQPSSGKIIIDDQTVYQNNHAIAPEKRRVGMVFQDYALFPNLTVAGNIVFGIRDKTKQQQQQRLQQLLEVVGMPDYATSYPHQLSGGQQQRVALARALAPKPSILLLDEPFSNLDIELREQLAREVRAILKQEQITAILVTHDQHEAFAMADHICVMNQGHILQQASAEILYRQPANEFVAHFVGESTIVNGTVNQDKTIETTFAQLKINNADSLHPGSPVRLVIRPEMIRIDQMSELKGDIIETIFRGSHYLYRIQLNDRDKLLCMTTSVDRYQVHDRVGIRIVEDYVIALSSDQTQ